MTPFRSIRLGISLALAHGCGVLLIPADAGPMYHAIQRGSTLNEPAAAPSFEPDTPDFSTASRGGYAMSLEGSLDKPGPTTEPMFWLNPGDPPPADPIGSAHEERGAEPANRDDSPGQAIAIPDMGAMGVPASALEGLAHAALLPEEGPLVEPSPGGITDTRNTIPVATSDRDGGAGPAASVAADSTTPQSVDVNQNVQTDTPATPDGGLHQATDTPGLGKTVDGSATPDQGTLDSPPASATANDSVSVAGVTPLDAQPGLDLPATRGQAALGDSGASGGAANPALDLQGDELAVGDSLVHTIYGIERVQSILHAETGVKDGRNALLDATLETELAVATAIGDVSQILKETAYRSSWDTGDDPERRAGLPGATNRIAPPPTTTPEPSAWILFAALCLPLMYRARRAAASRPAAR